MIRPNLINSLKKSIYYYPEWMKGLADKGRVNKNMFKDEGTGQTHAVCNTMLKEKGGNAKCCGCFPHKGCELLLPRIIAGLNHQSGDANGTSHILDSRTPQERAEDSQIKSKTTVATNKPKTSNKLAVSKIIPCTCKDKTPWKPCFDKDCSCRLHFASEKEAKQGEVKLPKNWGKLKGVDY